jgi:3-methyladenine DNA glycosylase Mpg
MNASSTAWQEANQAALLRALEPVYRALAQAAGVGESESSLSSERPDAIDEERAGPSALTRLCAAFNLTAFERDLLLVCAGVELASRVGAACAAA